MGTKKHALRMPPISPSELALSQRARCLPGSPLRALLSMRRPSDALNLGGGHPDIALFPSGALAELSAAVIRDEAPQSLQYAPTEGLAALREFIAQRLRQRGCEVTPDQIVVTHGSQQALATVAALVTSPEHPVALEQPGYPGALQAFSLAQAPVVPLPVTTDGWDTGALRANRPSAMYVMANFQNPTGRRATPSACHMLTRYAEESGVFLIEDDAYGELDFDGQSVRPLLADAPTRGLLLGTFSKTLCPGLRVGWIVAPTALVGPIVRILQASSLQPGTLAQHLAMRLLDRLDWEAHLTRLRNAYRDRAVALRERCEALGLHAETPRGGFYLWARTSSPATSLAELAARRGVISVPESSFRHPHCPGHDQHLRLAFSQYLDSPSQRSRLTAAFSHPGATAPHASKSR